LLGKTAESNDNFPERKLQKQFIFNIGRDQTNNPKEWARWLKDPKTGFGLGYTDFGNLDSLGVAFSVIPYIEFNAFRQKNLKVQVGMGGSYFTKKYHPITNSNNQAVTTNVTWSFRAYLYYNLISTKQIDWRLGIGYSHHSNGHTRLLNQGYNSFLVSMSADILNPLGASEENIQKPSFSFKKSVYSYFSLRGGVGQNVLGIAFNNTKSVYTLSGDYGHVLNNTFRLGIGFNYRLYEHYYDYIKNNESLVQEGREFEYFKESPWRYATNIAITLNGEFLLNHVGIDIQIGYNIHKPGYQIDWRINEGWDNTPKDIPESWMLGEYNSKYKFKKHISSRLGMKYYLIGNTKAPANNLYIGAHLNSNLGQADFTELSFGYVHSFNYKDRS